MKPKVIGLALAGVVLAFAAFILHLRSEYYKEYDRFRDAIKAEGFQIKKRWLYDEDFTLEDFGIYVTKGPVKFWIDVRYLSDVRSPNAKIKGVVLQSLHEGWRDNERVIASDSDLWKNEALPVIATPREFLANAHLLFPAIQQLKAKIPVTKDVYGRPEYRDFLILRDDPDHLAPVTNLFVEKAD